MASESLGSGEWQLHPEDERALRIVCIVIGGILGFGLVLYAVMAVWIAFA